MQTTNILELLAEHPEGSFLSFANFNDASFGTCSIEGVSPGWEMHPDTDEFFYIIEGEVQMTLLESSGETLHRASAGSAFVVPQGIWHKPGAPDGAKFIYFTPGESLYSEADDPRKEN
ncbi:MAG: cupin domain-containing protein [Pseudomonadales bacterium]|nr:cupin domain-containing protein [Pseudomonadales bacterium]